MAIDVARNFGKGTGFGLGLAFLGFIFYPILGLATRDTSRSAIDVTANCRWQILNCANWNTNFTDHH